MSRADQVLDGLDPEQRAVAAQPLGPMCVLAGAGTGKTRAITHRIAYGVHSGVYPPDRVLAVTFTARAAGEMRTRLRSLGAAGVQARTFHAAALRQLQYFWPQAVGGSPPQVISHKAPVLGEAAGRLRLRTGRTELRDLAGEIEWAKVGMLTPEGYVQVAGREGRRPAGYEPSAVARLMEVYEEVKGERHVIDFEDVLLLTVGVLEEHPRIAATIRDQYRHFVVDEYQDVNLVQQHLLDQWLGGRTDVCVVGDPAQTIYSFTGASAEHLRGFAQRYPDSEVVRLVRNYRSTPQIIGVANTVVRAIAKDGVPAVQLQAQPSSGSGPAPAVQRFDDEVAEASGVAGRIAALIDEGVQPSEIAVLFRTNSQSEAMENALARADISYLVRGGERFFSRAEVRQSVLLLRGAARSDDGSVPLADLVRDVLGGAGWSPEPPTVSGATRERWESLQAVVNLAEDLAAQHSSAADADGPGFRLPDLVLELDRRAAEQHAPTVQGVTLASFHAAKGLEWDAVFLIGCSDGLIPISVADGPSQIAEEQRLLYVGLTRARRSLHLSWAAAREPGGRAGRRMSRFLGPLGGVLEGAGPESGGGDGRDRRSRRERRRSATVPRVCRTCGGALVSAAERKIGRCEECPPSYDEQTFEALRSWRSATAAQQRVPAFVVFTDATLVAIAERRPGAVEELRTIPGVGPAKLDRYGSEVLEILGREQQPDPG